MRWQKLIDPAAIAAMKTASPDDPYTRQPQYQSRQRVPAVKRFPRATIEARSVSEGKRRKS